MTNKLEKNLELRKALAEVDRLTALNLELETVNKDLWIQQAKLDQKVSEQKERLRKNEVMLRFYEKEITELQRLIPDDDKYSIEMPYHNDDE